MYDLEDFERVIFREKGSLERFREYFGIGFPVQMVSWSTACMIVNGFSFQTHTSERYMFSIHVWNEYYEEYK